MTQEQLEEAIDKLIETSGLSAEAIVTVLAAMLDRYQDDVDG